MAYYIYIVSNLLVGFLDGRCNEENSRNHGQRSAAGVHSSRSTCTVSTECILLRHIIFRLDISVYTLTAKSAWSRGMIPASGAGGPGFNPRSGPGILRFVANNYFFRLVEALHKPIPFTTSRMCNNLYTLLYHREVQEAHVHHAERKDLVS